MEQSNEHMLVGIFFLVFVCLQMFIISVAAVFVSGQAHAPLEHLYQIRGQASTNEKQLVVCVCLLSILCHMNILSPDFNPE